jgi:hypothetical protein
LKLIGANDRPCDLKAPPSDQKEPEPPPPPELPPPENPPPPLLDEDDGGDEPTLPSASNMPPISGIADPEKMLPEPSLTPPGRSPIDAPDQPEPDEDPSQSG